MAKNECWSAGGGCDITLNEGDAAYFGAALDSGEAAEWSEFTGVALIDFAAASDGVMTRCTGFSLTVTPQDDGGASPVVVGDPLYFHDTTGVIDKAVNGGQFIGWAMVAVPSLATEICILLEQDPDYTRFMDEQLLEFGDGAAGKGGAGDFQMWFDLANGDMEMLTTTAACSLNINTDDAGEILMQRHDYGIGDHRAVRISPQITVDDATNAIMGLEICPGINDTIGGHHIVGLMSDIWIRGGVGDWTDVMRAAQFQITDNGVAGRTVTGPAILVRTWAQTHFTCTNGLYAFYSEAQGGTTAFAAWLHVDDDAGAQADLANAVGNVNAVIHVEIGATEGYIPVYDGYTPS